MEQQLIFGRVHLKFFNFRHTSCNLQDQVRIVPVCSSAVGVFLTPCLNDMIRPGGYARADKTTNFLKRILPILSKRYYPGDSPVAANNPKQSLLVSLSVLIILAALPLLSGCSAPPVNTPVITTTPAVPVTCSADSGVCPVTTPSDPGTCSADTGACTLPVPASVRINASPSRYSPFMSSTPGIRLTPVVSGFNQSGAEFVWNASYGHFLSWGSPDYTIRNYPLPVVNHGETIYWSFTEPVSPAQDPVIISLIVRNISSGQMLGNSSLTLGWEGNFTVILQDTR